MKRNGPSKKRNDLFAKRTGPNGKWHKKNRSKCVNVPRKEVKK